ncbi:MYB-like transcription factor ETC3 isoform X2 [Apium graveolens]|uniref:MYB-like transcription factor ETC3 isoform X2 n=1 Tax=Apium graveolens TaxID=4045 RepID=UPI003D7C1204
MDKECLTTQQKPTTSQSQDTGNTTLEFVKMTDEEEDLIFRMYRLVGQRWHLIAGRVPGRKPEEIQRFWMVKHQLALQNGSWNAGEPLVLETSYRGEA